jgi:hypothetical protein
MVWGVLLSRRLVSEQVGSTAYRVFENDMADITDKQLRHGMEKAKDFTGFFTTPAFRELCRISMADLGLPDPRKAMYEACKAPYPKDQYPWSHPIVYRTGCAVGWWEVSNLSEFDLWKLWETAYEELAKRIMNGESIELPVLKKLPQQVFVPAKKEHARSALDKIKAMI